MLNIEKYKDEIKEYGFSKVYLREKNVTIDGEKGVNLNIRNVVDWLCSEYKEPLLNDEDKEFLQDLMKWYTFERIHINLCNEIVLADDYKTFHICKPDGIFEKLEKLKAYTLEELGI